MSETMDLSWEAEELAWNFVRQRLDERVARGLLRLPPPPGEPVPEELHLELTHRCNLKCVMCEHWEIEHKDPESVERELGLPELRKIVDGSKRLGKIKAVVITGGEPWLRADFVDIIVWLTERFPDATICALTNFWNTGHIRLKLQELRARGVKNLKLGSSLDGLEDVHDTIRGQQGAFAGLVRTVKAVREELPEFSFGFTLTILPANAHQVYDTYRYVRDELGAGLGVQWAVETAGIAPLGWTPERKELALRGVHQVLLDRCRTNDALKRIRAPEAENGDWDWLWSDLLYWRWLEEFGRSPRRFDFFGRCTSGERHVMLDPEGSVFFCPVNRDRSIGNASEKPLDELWTGEKARAEREFVAEKKCRCWLRCVSTPALDRLLLNSRSAAAANV